MIATQDNTILIDFDTYTFHKGDEIKLSYINPFYINVDNAPDVQSLLQTSESNTCGMIVVPEDTIIWNNQDFMFAAGANGSVHLINKIFHIILQILLHYLTMSIQHVFLILIRKHTQIIYHYIQQKEH